jgi:hypothetical protein
LHLDVIENEDTRDFTIKLNITDLLLSNHDSITQMDVDQDKELVITRLKEKVLDIRKEDINSLVISNLNN